MRASTLLIVVCMVAGIAVLCALGSWQVKRLYWKEALIERINARLAEPPVSLDELLSLSLSDEDREYRPVTAKGIYDHSKEVYFFTTGKGGASGWNVHTPLKLEDGRILIVNRGFVPDTLRDPDLRMNGQVEGTQSITGLARIPGEKPNSFVPNNALEKREFYWRSFTQMASLMAVKTDVQFVPFFVDANEAPNPGGWPKGGATIISFPNSHMQYAVTWFGLALSLLVVGSFFLHSRRSQNSSA